MSQLSDDDISWLLDLVTAEELFEIEVESTEENWRVRIGRKMHGAAAPLEPGMQSSAPEAEQLPADIVPLLAPMNGVFYRAPSPDAPPYVEEGDVVERGQVVGLIEAMKVFSEIESPVNGVIVRIVVSNQQSVKADERLMLVRVGQ